MDAEARPDPNPFDAALQLEVAAPPAPDGSLRLRGRTHPAWANLVGPYGGITAAQALQAVLQHPQRLGDPVAFNGNFAAPVADGDFELEARPLRTNRSTQHWLVLMRQQDAVVFSATVLTARRRETWGATDARMPDAPAPAEVPVWCMPRPAPAWLSRYEMRCFEGAMPQAWDSSEHEHSRTRMWVRENPPRALDFPSLLALCDVFFPRVWLRRARPVPMGTVTLGAYFHAGADELAALGGGPWLVEASGQCFHHGYFDHTGRVWHADGRLLASTYQLVYYRE